MPDFLSQHSVMDRFPALLADLRSTFNKKILGGLTASADVRLKKTLEHYVGEVQRVKGPMSSELEILSLTYDSMVRWLKRKMVTETFVSEVDPDTLFASLKRPVEPVEPVRSYVQQKDVLQPQEDVVKYREVEYNLVMNSKDRDWLGNTTQNRYNFNIQFNTNFKGQGTGYQANIQTRLRNIVRIEFIKAILPVESFEILINPSSAVYYPFYSVLAMPSINILADEMQGNNFGTSNAIDKSLAVCQYDSTWRPDHFSNQPDNRGYALFIPKFMKAQRVYAPAPLANLQTLSFRIQDNQDNLLSQLSDSLSISTIAFGNTLTGSVFATNAYFFIKTSIWFPTWAFSNLDKIIIQGLGFISAQQPAGGVNLVQWLQSSTGHVIVGTAYNNGATVAEGNNAAGYCNWIIIQNQRKDPESGDTSIKMFTNSSFDEAQLAADILNYPQQGGLLNLSRQVQLTVRVVTREYDLATNIRPDNV